MRRELLPWHHHPRHPHVVVPVRIDPRGLTGPTPSASRCGGWRRVGPGWFVPSDVDPTDVDQRIVEAAVRLGAYGAATGWAALHWQGARWFDGSGATGPRPVALVTGDAGIRPVAGVLVSEERLLPHHIEVVDGLRLTVPVRSTLFEMRHAPDEVAATAALDMACYDDLVSIAEATAYAGELGTWTGIPQARTALAAGDENAWSPPEVAMRVAWERAGLGRLLTNTPLFDLAGKHLVTPDLLDPVRGVVGEYDGPGHLDRAHQRRDQKRDDLYRRLGLEQVVWLAHDLADDGPALRRTHEAFARAALRPPASRTWSTKAPSWWKPTLTVAQRRALSPYDRARLLGHRRP